jgi:hypothetical protein
MKAQARPCANCPWRRDVAPGEFPAERFRILAYTSEDMSPVVFTCHKSTEHDPIACAGFLTNGAAHNMSVRVALAYDQLELRDRSGGLKLHPNYRSMAVANGVAPDDRALASIRDDTQW